MTTSESVARVLLALRELGHEAKRSGVGWTCRCPAHDDRSPSLSINTGDDGRALINCHAGCQTEMIVGTLGLTMRDLMPEGDRARGNGHPTRATPKPENPARGARTYPTAREALLELERVHGRHAAAWVYRDAAGEPVGIVARRNTPTGKRILPISRNGTGWVLGGMPTPRPLYRLPELLADTERTIYVTEGEKAADAAVRCGLLATTSAHGSKSAKQADWGPLKGRDVVILPDHDDAGEAYARDVARLALAAGARSVRIVRLADRVPEAPEGFDIADLLALSAGDTEGTRRVVVELADATEPEAENAPTIAQREGSPVLIRLADVEPESVAWLWPGRFALGKLTLIAGDPGLGKSFLTLDMAARVSTGAGWPDHPHERAEPGGVVLLSAEDGIADTIRPRLDAAGADVSRIVALEAVRATGADGKETIRGFDMTRDLPALEDAIRSVANCQLAIIDPITAYLGGVDSHKNAEIRGLLAPLGDLAARHRVAVVAVTHLNKSGTGPAIYRAMGSLAFAAAARAAWGVAKDKDDPRRRLLLPIKNNIAPDTGGLAYAIEPVGVGGCPAVAWEPDPVNESADDALSNGRGEGEARTERDDAADWLTDLLADGPRLYRDIERESREAGHAIGTLRRAKAALGVVSRKPAFGGPWEWSLPTEDAHTPKMRTEDAHSPGSAHLRKKPDENTEDSPKVRTYQGVSTFGDGEHLRDEGSGDDWGVI